MREFPTNTLGMAISGNLIHKKNSKNTKIHLNSKIFTKIGFCALQLIITKSTTNLWINFVLLMQRQVICSSTTRRCGIHLAGSW